MLIRKSPCLGPLDDDLFNFSLRHKVGTVEQINKWVYQNYSLRSVYNRLSKLVKSGFIITADGRGLGRKKVFYLAPRVLKGLFSETDGRIKQIRSENPRHDLIVTSVEKNLKVSPILVLPIPRQILKEET